MEGLLATQMQQETAEMQITCQNIRKKKQIPREYTVSFAQETQIQVILVRQALEGNTFNLFELLAVDVHFQRCFSLDLSILEAHHFMILYADLTGQLLKVSGGG